MNPQHDWQTRLRRKTSWASDVEIQAFELVMLQDLLWDNFIGYPDQSLFDGLRSSRLRAYGSML